ncbi:hypothetical protein COHA_000974 [Chlorella ohadii]|uniref:Ysc84 actin-binding domain-containing protein n=1 Tax=Chlorella ohadii TaxID=2649997 RepID=A0AAD5H691_9CHLO|nr:hypothetical protein COHA_000974 [Chlorella ohadii]
MPGLLWQPTNGSSELTGAAGCASEVLASLIEAKAPHFLVEAKAVILARVYKAGCGLALERGSGLLLARLPCASGKGLSVDSFKGSPRDARWSAPAFLSLSGLSSGFTLGAQRADLLIGVMSDDALERFVSGGTLALGAEWSICLAQLHEGDSAAYRNHDLAICMLTRGMMVDFSLSCASLSIDQGRNSKAYGADISTEALLHGEVPLPECCAALARQLTEAEGRVVASAFEPSNRSGAYW